MLAIFVGTIVAIIGKAMPIGISVIAISIVAASGVTGDTPGRGHHCRLSSYANPLIWLIAIAIMISRGLIKTGLGARIGYYFISIFASVRWGSAMASPFPELSIAPVTPAIPHGVRYYPPIMRSIAHSLTRILKTTRRAKSVNI